MNKNETRIKELKTAIGILDKEIFSKEANLPENKGHTELRMVFRAKLLDELQEAQNKI